MNLAAADAFFAIFGMRRVEMKDYTVYGIYRDEGEIACWGGKETTPENAVKKAEEFMLKRSSGDHFTAILVLSGRGKELWRREYYN